MILPFSAPWPQWGNTTYFQFALCSHMVRNMSPFLPIKHFLYHPLNYRPKHQSHFLIYLYTSPCCDSQSKQSPIHKVLIWIQTPTSLLSCYLHIYLQNKYRLEIMLQITKVKSTSYNSCTLSQSLSSSLIRK